MLASLFLYFAAVVISFLLLMAFTFVSLTFERSEYVDLVGERFERAAKFRRMGLE